MKFNILHDKQIMMSSGIIYLKAGEFETDNKEVIAKLDGALHVELIEDVEDAELIEDIEKVKSKSTKK